MRTLFDGVGLISALQSSGRWVEVLSVLKEYAPFLLLLSREDDEGISLNSETAGYTCGQDASTSCFEIGCNYRNRVKHLFDEMGFQLTRACYAVCCTTNGMRLQRFLLLCSWNMEKMATADFFTIILHVQYVCD